VRFHFELEEPFLCSSIFSFEATPRAETFEATPRAETDSGLNKFLI
jgi:hypothetical protein